MTNSHADALAAQATRLASESAKLHERDQAEITRLLGDLVSLQGRYQLLEMSILSTSSAAGQQFAQRNDPEAAKPHVEVVVDQGTPWDRARRRMMKEDNDRYEREEAIKRAREAAGSVPTPPEYKPGESPRPENDLARTG